MQNKHRTFFSFFGGPTYAEGEGGLLVGPNAQLFPKMDFEGPPHHIIIKQRRLKIFSYSGIIIKKDIFVPTEICILVHKMLLKEKSFVAIIEFRICTNANVGQILTHM